MQITQALSNTDVEAARGLIREYASWIAVDLCFQGFAEELGGLPGLYAPPGGRLFVARSGQEPAGCVALRPLGDKICEMKRLFVRPAFQGQGVGRALAERVIADGRSIGYGSMVLDTLPSMNAAIKLYESLGFSRRSAYYSTPLPQTVFMELAL